MKLTNVDLLKLLPQFMRNDPVIKSLANVSNLTLQSPARKLDLLRTWDKIDELPEWELDELAWELKIDWYDYGASIAIKRELIKSSNNIHSRRGTKWAVEEIIRIYFGDAILTEWFEYGGDPYYFRIFIPGGIPPGREVQKFERVLELTKNVRSWLEKIETILPEEMTEFIGVVDHGVVSALDQAETGPPETESNSLEFIGIADHGIMKALDIAFTGEPERESSMEDYVGIGEHNIIKALDRIMI